MQRDDWPGFSRLIHDMADTGTAPTDDQQTAPYIFITDTTGLLLKAAVEWMEGRK